MPLPDAAYAHLLGLRTNLRHFERWSQQQARRAGLTPAHHQLLLSIRGHDDPRGPTVGEVADYLLLRHHSTVGLIDRADVAGLVTRVRDTDDHRVVRLRLTKLGARRLEQLSTLHLEELERMAPELAELSAGLAPVQTTHGFASIDPPEPEDRSAEALEPGVRIARVYGEPSTAPGVHILVDRLWPRGISKSRAPFSEWAKDAAPTAELRTWYGHVPERFQEFARRYRAELGQAPARAEVDDLRARAAGSRLVLVTATRDLERSGAAVLRDVLSGRSGKRSSSSSGGRARSEGAAG
ncbi:MAG: DUF488 family protein, N3 subclade [Acidimicrobiales bacterium]